MSDGYALLPKEEDDIELPEIYEGFGKNRRRWDDDTIQVPYKGRVRMSKSSVLKILLSLSVLLNLALIGFLLWTRFMPFDYWSKDDQQVSQTKPVIGLNGHSSSTPPSVYPNPNDTHTVPTAPPCGGNSSSRLKPPSYSNIFQDLRSQEIKSVEQYLFKVKDFELVEAFKAELTSNFIFSIELQTPNKSSALHFLDNKGRPPAREALAVLFLPSFNPPAVEEYVVGPLPKPTYHYRNPRRDKSIDFRIRQFNNVEMGHAIRTVQQALGAKIEQFLQKHYGAHFFGCVEQCLTFTSSAVSSVFSKERRLWINAMYMVEFSTLHALGFQFLLTMVGLDSSKWYIEKVWYADKLYDSFDDLIDKYELGETPKINLRFPKVKVGEDSLGGSLNIKGKQFPRVPQAGPRQYEPHGHRYTVQDEHVEYLQQWSFNYRMSYASAIQLYDVKFGGQRIAYEISLQEIIVLYAGANPATMHSQLADSAFGLSRNAHGLVPGVDCPDYATFLPVTLFGADHPDPFNYPNSVCIFEHNNNVPARRHKAHSYRSGSYYQGLVDNVLILRTVYVMYNYDYILDFIFHQSGALEIKVLSTGYILSAFYTNEEKPFGFRVLDDTLGSIHHHMFNFKIDVDILGTNNRYETLNFKVDNVTRSWYDNGQPIPQLSFEHDLKHTEQDAAYKFNFDTPRYHVIYNNNMENKFSGKRGYRLQAHGFSKQMLPEDSGALNTYTWSRYQMAVTKRKDEEQVSSSMHAIFDSGDPVVSLQSFIDDNENIVDQDLVAWATVGMLHLPHTEDIPNTPTTGTEATITLLPYNYFQECPSMGARDAVRIDGQPDFRVNNHGIPQDVSCVPSHLTSEDISKQKDSIFMAAG
ncbi:putative amine oxidase [copper-containing] isoform X1 [Haliotis rufescens]|uniref:putative amine oxidase [copper-containing] isoform X1 n=2 Tax=Haliotis rufescens TaxID=6454 RepID=UPI001EAFDDF0|nr:putative amine oxidase [copper-containing] isoform X1 [Haliotis rufescens]